MKTESFRAMKAVASASLQVRSKGINENRARRLARCLIDPDDPRVRQLKNVDDSWRPTSPTMATINWRGEAVPLLHTRSAPFQISFYANASSSLNHTHFSSR